MYVLTLHYLRPKTVYQTIFGVCCHLYPTYTVKCYKPQHLASIYLLIPSDNCARVDFAEPVFFAISYGTVPALTKNIWRISWSDTP
jgi:hypothetical protein